MLNETAVADQKGAGKVSVLKPSRADPRPEQGDENGVAVWEPKERRTEQFNTRITKSLKDRLQAASEVLTHVQRVQDADVKAEVAVADLVERALSAWLDSVFSEMQIEPPATPEEIEAAKVRALEFYLKLSKSAAIKAKKEVEALEAAAKEAAQRKKP